MSIRISLVIGMLAALVASPSPVRAQVLTEKNISIKMALAIAETALNECTPRVSVAVLDRAGRLRVFLQGDGAAPHNLELARRRAARWRFFWGGEGPPPHIPGPPRRKAYTALTFRRTSADWAKRTAEG